eukprot:scaffold570_cov169-Alexandrium_tamarense.AAC.14
MGRKCDAEAGRIVRGVGWWCSEKCGTGGGEGGPRAKKREYSVSSTIFVGRTEKPGSNGLLLLYVARALLLFQYYTVKHTQPNSPSPRNAIGYSSFFPVVQ